MTLHRRGRLTRRAFLNLVMLAAAFAVNRRSSAAAQALSGESVIVIGAGLAGLAAARDLQDQGAEVMVLEAKDHIGGRLRTDWSLGAPFELGAGWIHGPIGNPISALADQVGATTFVTDDDSLSVFAGDGKAASDGDLTRLDSRYEALLEAIDEEVEASADMSLAAAIRQVDPGAMRDPLMAWALAAFTEFDTGGPLEALSAYYFDEDDAFDGADVVVTTGYDKILAPLAKDLDIRLGSPVSAVAYDEDDGVAVTAGGQRFEADYAVCTLPLGVLKSGAVRFDPALPSAHRGAIEAIPFGNVTKAALKFPRAFWPTDVQYFGYQSAEKGKWPYFMSYRTFAAQNILVGLSVGAYAGKVEQRDDATITAEIMVILRTMFGPDIPEPEELIVTRWSRDPYSRGAYSFTGVDVTPDHYDRLAEPVEDRLVFAGEHTVFDHHATTHGALESGRAAAEAVVELVED